MTARQTMTAELKLDDAIALLDEIERLRSELSKARRAF